jgi:hypothetical protein
MLGPAAQNRTRKTYARQNMEAELLVSASALPWSIVRLCAVFPLTESAMDPDTLRFAFALPYDRKEQAMGHKGCCARYRKSSCR